MGYDTDFEGQFILNRPLSPEHKRYLEKFSNVRHMSRDFARTAVKPDPIRQAVGLPLGKEADYYVNDDTSDIVENNCPPQQQPGLWCGWTPNADGTAIIWNNQEKFYNYVEWITYLIHHFLQPWGYSLNGEVTWTGEDEDDGGLIKIVDNKISIYTLYPKIATPYWRDPQQYLRIKLLFNQSLK